MSYLHRNISGGLKDIMLERIKLAQFTFLFIVGIHCVVQLQCGIDEYCLNNDPVQYQCTVTDSNILQWRIRDENMASLGTVAYATVADLVTTPAPFSNSLPFFTDYTSKSPSIIVQHIIHCTVQYQWIHYTLWRYKWEFGELYYLILQVMNNCNQWQNICFNCVKCFLPGIPA